MQIKNTSNQLNFKQVQIIQIPKKAFKNPDDLKECSKSFCKALEGNFHYNLGHFLSMTGALGRKVNKFAVFLEWPSYGITKEPLEKAGGYSRFWLSRNTGVPVAEPMDKNYHSFFVLTKEHKDKALSLSGIKTLMKKIHYFYDIAIQKHPTNKTMRELLENSLIGNFLDKALKNVIGSSKVSKIQLGSLDSLKTLARLVK